MSGIRPLTTSTDVIYVYDGSFGGFLCCVYESVYSSVTPTAIVALENQPITFFDTCVIETDLERAERVLASIPKKISWEAKCLVETLFLSCLVQKELLMLNFLLKGYREGAGILKKLGDPDVSPLLKAERHLLGEAHLLKGFVRFSDYDGYLAGTITPKNFILPFIADHFTQRFSNENFMIFDKTHKAALIYQNRLKEIISVDNIELPPVSDKESQYQEMWKNFYNTVSIQARENPKCRMTHMPKRYWENMLEVRDFLT